MLPLSGGNCQSESGVGAGRDNIRKSNSRVIEGPTLRNQENTAQNFVFLPIQPSSSNLPMLKKDDEQFCSSSVFN